MALSQHPAQHAAAPTTARARSSAAQAAVYLATGTLFGVVLVKSQVVSWFRIQEMFRFQSFHMYGVIGSAIVVAGLTTWLLRRAGVRALDGRPLRPVDKGAVGPRHALGGLLFGLGWAATGACPGAILALVGAGMPAYLVVFAGALLGTAAYGFLRGRLPH